MDDAVAEVRAMRDRDNEIVAAKWARLDAAAAEMPADPDPDAEARMLRELGLTD